MRGDYFENGRSAIYLGTEPRWSFRVMIGGVNLSSLGRVIGFEWGETVDGIATDATITLQWRRYLSNASPFLSGADLSDVVRSGALIQIMGRLYCEGKGDATEALLFNGVIDAVDLSGDSTTATVTCRDAISATLQDRWIKAETIYGREEGRDIGLVIGDILRDWLGWGDQLFVGFADFAITLWRQDPAPIATALEQLAALIGFHLRPFYNPQRQAFLLELRDPVRSSTTPDMTWPVALWRALARASEDLSDVRNVVEVFYKDGKDASGNYKFSAPVIRTDSASVAKYGERWMQIKEGSTSQIDTLAEAEAFADAVLSDLSEPLLNLEIEVPLFPWIEVGDLARFAADGVYFGADQDVGVVAVRHVVTADSASTRLVCAGKRIAGRRRWLDREARPGQASTARKKKPLGSAAFEVLQLPKGAGLRFAQPPDGRWDRVAVYRGTTEDFTPSEGTLVNSTRGLQVVDPFAEPGVDYWYKIVPQVEGLITGEPSRAITVRGGAAQRADLSPELRATVGLRRIASANNGLETGDAVAFNDVWWDHATGVFAPDLPGIETNAAPTLVDVRVTLLPGTQDAATWYCTVHDASVAGEIARSATLPTSQALTISDVISLNSDGFLEVRIYPSGGGGSVGVAVGSSFKVMSLVPGEAIERALPPTATAPPSITGTPQVGEVLSGADGTWSGGTTEARQWLRDGAAISSATGTTYTLTSDDRGALIQFGVRRNATGSAGGTWVSSATIGPILPADADLPPSGTISISGTTQSGETLTLSTSITGADTTVIAWLRNGALIESATSSTYVLTEDDVASTVSARVTATNAAGETILYSTRRGPITPTPITPPADPALLLETGDDLLLETGDRLLLES